ncbi:MAG: O-antigen ligase protein [Verrucomicrobiales bacterium]|nr:O-antigen ligase protein [Verrucomicrobiales bacterium]
MPDSSVRMPRQPSWWAEGWQFAKWDPFGFGVLTTPFMLFIMPMHWVPRTWLLLWTLVALIKGGELFHLPTKRGRAVPILAMFFLGWMWSSVFYGVPDGWQIPAQAAVNGLSLVLYLLGIWRVARKPSRLDWMLKGLIGMGVSTAVISVPVYYMVRGHTLPYERLENVIPYFTYGLYAVNSGMLWAFAGVAAAAGFVQSRTAGGRAVLGTCLSILIGAVFLTQTRGALLGVGAAMLVLMLTKPMARWLPLLAVIAVTGWTCQNLPSLLPTVFPSAAEGNELLLASPGEHMLARADSGRLQLYQELWRRVEGAAEVVMGRGFWARNTTETVEIAWAAPHPHGVFISTAYHGGLIGLSLLGLLLWAGARRSIWLAVRGIDVRWLAFLAAGTASLCFDGHTLALFQTVPLFEPLLFWLPLIAGASLATKIMDDTPAGALAEEML